MFRTRIIYKIFLSFLIFSILLLLPLMLTLDKGLKDIFRAEEAIEGKYIPPEYSEHFDRIHDDARKEIFRHFLSIAFYSFFAAFMLSLFLTRGLHKSLRFLTEGAKKIRDGDLEIDFPVLAEDELGEVTRAFNEMARSLRAKTEELTRKDLYIQNMMDALWVVDEDDRIVDINPAFTKLLGYRREEVIGTSVYDYVDEANERIIRRELEDKRAVGIPSTYEVSLIARDGSQIPVLITGAPIIKDGESTGKIGIIKDFRPQHRLMTELKESKEHLETIMNNIQDAILIIDRDYRIVRANRASLRRYGPDIVGRKCFEVSHHGVKPCWHEGEDCPIQHVFSEGEVFRHVHEHYTSTGEKRYEEIVASPITGNAGEPMEIIELLRDITESKIYEKEISRRHRELMLLNSIAAIIHRSLKADEVLSSTLDRLIDMLGMDGGGFFILDESSRILNCSYHRGISDEFVKEAGRIRLGEDIPGRVALTGELITTSDIGTDRRISRTVLRQSGIKGYCCIPVKGKERILGVYCLFSYKPYSFSEEDVRILRSVGEMAGLALENIRLYEQMRQMFHAQKERRVREQESLLNLTERLATAIDVNDVVEFSSSLTRDALKAEIILFWSNTFENHLRLSHAEGIRILTPEISIERPTPETHAVETQAPVNIKSINDEHRYSPLQELREEGIHSLLAFPVCIGERCIGVFTLGRRTPADFKEDDIHLMRIITSIFGVALERSKLYESRIIEKGLAEAILNTISEGVCTVDRNGVISSANRSLERLLGIPVLNLVGRKYQEIFGGICSDELPVKKALSGEEAKAELNLNVGGIDHIVEVRSLPLIDPHGEIYGSVQVLRDVTQEKEIDRIKTDLIRSVSHEFRTPLSAIVGLSEMLLDNVVSGKKAKNYLETIHNEGTRLASMVSDLLDISRIEAGKVKLKTEEIEIESLLRSVQKILDRELTAKGISFKYMVEAGIPPLQADEERIRQILLNLIDNSIKYSDPDSSIEIQVLEEQDYVIIKVKDSGWGIPPEDLHHIGKRFYRGRHGSITKGTGLGLALCHEIVEMHGGRMEIESTPGAGTVVRIYLPVRRSDA